MYRHRRKEKLSIFHTAGWLFADLLLALTIIFIAASASGKPVLQAKTTTPTATLAPTATPTPVPQIQGLDRNPITLHFSVDPAQLGQRDIATSIKNQMIQKLNQLHNGNRKVGFVLTFAGGENGVHNAGVFNNILRGISTFKNAVFKNYHDLTPPVNEFNFDLELYFFLS